MVRDIVNDRCTSANYGPLTDRTAWTHQGADSQKSTFAYIDAACDVASRPHVRKGGNNTVMVDRCPCIDNDVVVEFCIRIDDCAGCDDNADS